MDTVKDIKSPAPIGQDKLPSSATAISKADSLFKDARYSYLYKKTERIVTAVHIVTNFISSNEPIRVRLRERSIGLLSDVISLKTQGSAVSEQTLFGSLVEIVSLVSSAQSAGYISPMNGGLIREEVEHLVDFIRENKEVLTRGVGALEREEILPEDNAKGDIPPPKKQGPLVKRTQKSGMSLIKSERHSERKADILKIFDTKDRITVRDVIKAMPSIGDKTLQRELLALVSEGVLVKEGERRWSTYTMRKRQ